MTTERPEANTGPSESSRGDTGEAIDRILSDWQNWSATKLSETEMARLAYDVQELIRGEVTHELKTIRNIKGLPGEAQLHIGTRLRVLSSTQTDGTA